MKEQIRKKRGQVTIFVIVAIFIIFVIALFLTFRTIKPKSSVTTIRDPHLTLERCIRNSVEDVTDTILTNGGFINPKNYKKYDKKNITYLCEYTGYYKPCNNLHPFLIEEIKKEILNYTFPIIEGCFLEFKRDAEKENNIIDMGVTKVETTLFPERISFKINKNIKIKKNDEVRNFNDFSFDLESPIYNLASLAIEIATEESKFCEFEYNGYMLLYPRYKIKRTLLSDYTKIYTIEDKKFKKKMNFAIRGCALPAGFG